MGHEAQVFNDSEVESLNPGFNEGRIEKPRQPENGILAQAASNLEAAQIAASAVQREKDEAALARARAEIALDDELAPQFTAKKAHSQPSAKYNSGNVKNVVVPNHAPGDNRAQIYE